MTIWGFTRRHSEEQDLWGGGEEGLDLNKRGLGGSFWKLSSLTLLTVTVTRQESQTTANQCVHTPSGGTKTLANEALFCYKEFPEKGGGGVTTAQSPTF